MVVGQIIKQNRFYLDFKSFTYCNLFNKTNQISRKKEKAGEELVVGKEGAGSGQHKLDVLGWMGIWKKAAIFLFKIGLFPSEK